MSSSWTVGQVVDQAVELGIVDAETAAERVQQSTRDEMLDYYGTPDAQAVIGLLDTLGIRYSTDYKTFRHVDEDGLELYEEELGWIVAATHGALTITDVELVEAKDDDWFLRFRCDGQPVEWVVSHGSDADFDVQMTFAMNIGELVPAGSTKRWCMVEPDDPDVGSESYFGDPAALAQFGAPFGLTFTPA